MTGPVDIVDLAVELAADDYSDGWVDESAIDTRDDVQHLLRYLSYPGMFPGYDRDVPGWEQDSGTIALHHPGRATIQSEWPWSIGIERDRHDSGSETLTWECRPASAQPWPEWTLLAVDPA